MPREQSSELRYAFIIGGLEAAEEGVVDVGRVARVAVSGCYDAGVDASAIASPNFDHGARDGVTGFHVDDLGVEDEFHALLGFGEILADIFPSYIWKVLMELCKPGWLNLQYGP